MSNTVTWIHDEMLAPDWVRPGRPAVFVFDEEWIEQERISLKRLVFLYECLLEMPGVEIVRGDVVEEVAVFAKAHRADQIETARSPLPRVKRQGESLRVRWIDPEPIVTLPEGADLKRFSRYWRKVEKQVLRQL